MVKIDIYYEGDLHCRAIHGPSGNAIQTDAPIENHGRGTYFSPTDLIAVSLGTCMMTLMGIAARSAEVDLRHARVVVQKEMSKDLPRRIISLFVDCFLPLPGDHPQKALLESAALNCPVYHSLHPEIEKKVRFRWL